MNIKQNEYIAKYNKDNYKMYQFRVKKEDRIIEYLDNKEKRNSYIVSLIEKDAFSKVLKLKDIKRLIKPILFEYGIDDIYLFGSYARGEANSNSDVDILCEKGNIKNLIDQGILVDKLEEVLGKKVDLVFISSKMNDYFKSQIKEDLIKLC